MPEIIEERGTRPLPANLDAERFILGACLTGKTSLYEAIQRLDGSEFSATKHKILFTHIKNLAAVGFPVDRVTLINSLMAAGDIDVVDGMSYVSSLDDGLPELIHIGAYIDIVKEKAALRVLIGIQQHHLGRALSEDGTAQGIACDLDHEIYTSLRVKRESRAQSLAQIADATPINRRLDPKQKENGKESTGIYTGFSRLDELTDGFHDGENWIIGAAPRVGKTAILTLIAKNNAAVGNPVLIFSKEMNKEALYQRLICQHARVPMIRYRTGDLNEKERLALMEADAYIHDLPIYIDDSRNLRLSDIAIRTQRAKEEWGIKLAGVDFIQKIRGNPRLNRHGQMTEICDGFINLAADTVPFVLLSQLNRSNRRLGLEPTLEDLQESGSIEQAGEIIVFPWREDLVKKNQQTATYGKSKFILAKNRNGEVEHIPMEWIGFLMMYRDVGRQAAGTLDY